MRHIGPVAQDFNTQFAYLFGEVESPIHIDTMHAVGVSLAATQSLCEKLQEQDTRIPSLEAENAALRSDTDDLEARLEALETAAGSTSAQSHSGQASPLPWAGTLLGTVGLVWASRRRSTADPVDGGGR